MLTAFGSKALEFRAFLINCPSAGKSVRRDAVFKEAFFIELRIENILRHIVLQNAGSQNSALQGFPEVSSIQCSPAMAGYGWFLTRLESKTSSLALYSSSCFGPSYTMLDCVIIDYVRLYRNYTISYQSMSYHNRLDNYT